jgi:hypothetical protein
VRPEDRTYYAAAASRSLRAWQYPSRLAALRRMMEDSVGRLASTPQGDLLVRGMLCCAFNAKGWGEFRRARRALAGDARSLTVHERALRACIQYSLASAESCAPGAETPEGWAWGPHSIQRVTIWGIAARVILRGKGDSLYFLDNEVKWCPVISSTSPVGIYEPAEELASQSEFGSDEGFAEASARLEQRDEFRTGAHVRALPLYTRAETSLPYELSSDL